MYYISEIVKLRKDFFSAFNSGEYSDAIRIGNDMLKIYKDNNDCSGLEYANDVNNLAIVYDNVLLYNKAVKLYQNAAQIREERLGESSTIFADTLSNWAVACSLGKMVNEAYGLHKKALKIREQNLKETDIDVISSYYNMGSACEDLKRYDKAEQYYEGAIEKAEKQPQYTKSDYADIMLGLARVEEKRGLFLKSAQLYESAIEIVKKTEGEKSFYYLSVVLEAAALCDNAKMYSKSIDYYETAAKIRKGILDYVHLDFITNLNNLAAVYRKTGQGKKALATHNEALNLIKNLVGEDHPFYLDCIASMGEDCLADKNFDEAEKYFKQAISLKEKDREKDAAGYTNLLERYAKCCLDAGETDKAEELLHEGLEIRKRKFGEENLLFADSLSTLAYVYSKKNMLNKSAQLYREAIEIRLNAENGKNSALADNYRDIALIMCILKNKDYALRYIEECLNLRRKIFGRSHPRFAQGLVEEGKIKNTFALYNAADTSFKEAMEILYECVGTDSKDAKNAADEYGKNCIALAKQYFEKNENEQSIKWFEKAEKLFNIAENDTLNKVKAEFAFLYALNGNLEKAEKMLDEAEKFCLEKYGDLSSEYMEVIKYKGEFNVKYGSFEKGEKLLFKVVEILYSVGKEKSHLQSEISLFMGKNCLEMGRYKRASSYFENAAEISENMDYAEALCGYGACLIKMDNIEEAKKKLMAAKTYMDEYADTNSLCYAKTAMLLGSICEKKCDTESACIYYNVSISKRRALGIKDAQFRKDAVKLASVLKKTDKKEEAASMLKEAAEADGTPQDSYKLFLRSGKLYVQLKQYDNALRLLKRAETLSQNLFGFASEERAAVIYDEAVICMKCGKKNEALEFFESLRDLLKENPSSKFADDRYFEKYRKLLEK